MSRKKELNEIANYLGNAAAHAALLPKDNFANKEVNLYSSNANDSFIAKHWNKNELEYIRSKALVRAKSEIRIRIPKYGYEEKDFENFSKTAEEFIERFISQAEDQK